MISTAHVLVLFSALFCTKGEQVAMKIVEEPSNYGWNNMWNQQADQPPAENALTMRVSPANFSGPEHFRKLGGTCFTLVDVSYKYELCPFFNVTQNEQTLRWNPYHGILGVFQQWEIKNNTFTAMLFEEGDGCGNSQRMVRVVFVCGDENKITNVSEPKTCQYLMHFQTPYVCHPHSMLVYPTLPVELRDAWDNLEGELYREEVTPQGYGKKLNKIFENAGYYLSGSKKKELAEKAKDTETMRENAAKGDFENLAKCSEEYKLLKKEVEGLRTLLALGGVNDGSVAQNNTANHGETKGQNSSVLHGETMVQNSSVAHGETEAQNRTAHEPDGTILKALKAQDSLAHQEAKPENDVTHDGTIAQNISDKRKRMHDKNIQEHDVPLIHAEDNNIQLQKTKNEHNGADF